MCVEPFIPKNTNYIYTLEKIHKDKIHIIFSSIFLFFMWKNYTVYVFFLSVYSNKAILVDRCRLAEKVADVLEGVLKALFDVFASLFNILADFLELPANRLDGLHRLD